MAMVAFNDTARVISPFVTIDTMVGRQSLMRFMPRISEVCQIIRPRCGIIDFVRHITRNGTQWHYKYDNFVKLKKCSSTQMLAEQEKALIKTSPLKNKKTQPKNYCWIALTIMAVLRFKMPSLN